MDRDTFLGGSPLGVFVRLVVLSLVIGIILNALGISPYDFLEKTIELSRRIFGYIRDALGSIATTILIGATIVVPIWLIVRLVKTMGRSDLGR